MKIKKNKKNKWTVDGLFRFETLEYKCFNGTKTNLKVTFDLNKEMIFETIDIQEGDELLDLLGSRLKKDFINFVKTIKRDE